MHMRKVAVAGVYLTRQARSLYGRTSFDVTLEAVTGALDDAGLTFGDVDGVAVDWNGPGGQADESGSWTPFVGHNLAYTTSSIADSSGVRGVLKAAAAVASGLCDVAVVGGGRAGTSAGAGMVGADLGLEFVDLWGATSVPRFALVAARHMARFGTKPEQLARVAATIRNHGHVNPEAVMFGKGPYTPEDVLASRLVSTPFHLLDVCIMSEGGAAVVLTTLERARDLRRPPVVLLGGGLEYASAPQVEVPTWERVGRLGASAARRCFSAASIGVADIDVLNVYDPNSFEVIRQFEALGLCGEGEGGGYVDEGRFSLDGPLPTNTDGGLLSFTWLYTQQTTVKVVESVRQIRGTAVNQVDGAEVAVATNGGSATGQYACAAFGADR
jgi:acetyl-CoA acetyltransferase